MDPKGTRLNKFLASCGVASRRACDALIQAGGVTVNGHPCTNPAVRIANNDLVRVEGRRVTPMTAISIVLNKPRGLVCSKRDELGRPTIYKALPAKFGHLNHVGRLDRDSEGLLVLTNDGALANRLTHPGQKTEKEYRVTLATAFENEILDQLLAGVHTPNGRARAKAVRRLSPRRLSITLDTGQKRQIRHMFQALGHRVSKLVRTRIGAFTDPNLPPGRWRLLDPPDMERLTQPPRDPARGLKPET